MDARTERNLNGVHPHLVHVFRAAADEWSVDGLGVIVTEGVRTLERQAELYRVGASQTMNSRHLTGHALDVAILLHGDVRWDWPLYSKFGVVMKYAAQRLAVPIAWGGDWAFHDGPHFELSREVYQA